MPKIPFATSTNMLPVSSPGGHVSRWETGEGFGEGISNLAGIMEKYQAHKDEIIKTRQLIQFDTDLVNRGGEFNDFLNGQSAYSPDLEEKGKGILNGVREGLMTSASGETEEVRLRKQNAVDTWVEANEIRLKTHADKLLETDSKVTLTQSGSALLEKVKQGLVTADIAGPFHQEQINQMKALNVDPIWALDYEGKWNKAINSAKVTSTLDNTTKQYGAETTLGLLNDPKTRRDLINQSDTETVNAYHTILSENVTWSKQQQEKAEKYNEEKFSNNVVLSLKDLNAGKITPGDLIKSIEGTNAIKDGGKKLNLINQVRDYVKDNSPYMTTENPVILNQIMTRAITRDPTLSVPEIQSHIGPGGYSVDDGLKAISQISTPANAFKDKLITNADDYFKKAIFPPDQILDDEEYFKRSQSLMYARSMLEQRIGEETKKGKSLDDLLMVKFDNKGNIVNKDSFLLDNIIQMFAPGAMGAKEEPSNDDPLGILKK